MPDERRALLDIHRASIAGRPPGRIAGGRERGQMWPMNTFNYSGCSGSNPPKIRAPLPEVFGPITEPRIKLLVEAAEANATVRIDGVEAVPEIVSVSQSVVGASWDEEARVVGPPTYRIRFIHANAFEWSDE
jgi:hypothetical protein